MGACDLDTCNGAEVTAATGVETYAYFATNWHPFGPTCFGPANLPLEEMEPQRCSANPRVC